MISREEAIKELEFRSQITSGVFHEALDMAISALSQPERSKGRWVEEGLAMWKYSECGLLSFSDSHFCSDCGADMREVKWVDTGISPEIIHTAEPSRLIPPQHLRITQDDETIKNFILCKSPDGKVGYYETEEEKFYEFDMRGEEE